MNDSLFQFLLDQSEARPLTVTELNAEVRGTLERGFSNVWVEGEVVGFVRAASGHWYFNLNDGDSQIRCVCWKGTNYRIRFKPQDGLTVRVRGRITLYEVRGEIQLSVDSLEPSGEGALAAAYEQIKARLDREGLFADELKRPLPFLPRRVAVVTSRTGAAFHDIYSVLTRRSKSVSLLLAPALVQGEGAADSIRRALTAVNKYSRSADEQIDVVIVGRGGGSAEDLWAFNDEALARAIRSSEIPVISAVGHEIDWTIADLVADRRAATPSAAAEIVAGREEDILADLGRVESTLKGMVDYVVLTARTDLRDLSSALATNFGSTFRNASAKFSDISRRLHPAELDSRASALANRLSILDQRRISAIDSTVRGRQEKLGLMAAQLGALSPLGVLSRGYSITETVEGRILRESSAVTPGDTLKIRLERGKLEVEVLKVD